MVSSVQRLRKNRKHPRHTVFTGRRLKMFYFITFIIAAVAVGCVLIVKGGNRFDVDDYDDIKDKRL